MRFYDMTKRKFFSAILAALMAMSSLTVLTSCNKDEEPVKEKRTNVFSGTEIAIPEGIEYINSLNYSNGKIYFTYNKEYTITYNELGEEVERRPGYNFEENGWFIEEMPVVEEVVEAEVQAVATDTDGDGIADGAVTEESAESETMVDVSSVPEATMIMVETAAATPAVNTNEGESTGDKLPEGWWYGYDSVQCICIVPLDGGESTEFSIDIDDEYGYFRNLMIGVDETIVVGTNMWEYDEETQMSYSKFYIHKLDSATGEITSTFPLNDVLSQAGLDPSNTYINNIIQATDGSYYITTDVTILRLNSDFQYQNALTIDSGWINQIIMVGDKPLVTYYSDGSGYVCKYIENNQFVDVESETIKSIFDNYYTIIGASNERIYYSMNAGVYIYDFATDTSAELLNYINSDINPNITGNMIALDDGRIVRAVTDWNVQPSSATLQVLSKVPDEQLQEEIIVRVGCTYASSTLTRAIMDYHKQNTGIRITVQSYEQYNNEENEWNGAVQQLNNDIITGKVPDIIFLNSSLPVESYFQKGVFADLNPYIDDPEKGLNRTEYLQNVFDANSVDGKLYSMILSFRLQTLVAKSQYVGTEPGWTFEEMMACINSMPEGMTAFFDLNRENIVRTFFDNAMGSFVNWETGETKFESQGFIDLIKYIATCPEKGYWESYYDSMGDDYVYDPEAEREMSEKYELRYYKDYGLFSEAYINSYTSMMDLRNQFASADITAIGYPRDDENTNGAIITPNMEFAISATSKAKDEAWEIIKFFMNDTNINGGGYRFSINKKINEENYANAESNYYYNESENYEWATNAGYSEDYINYLKQTNQKYDQSAVDQIKQLVEGAGEIQRTDSDLVEIITEELSTFFAGTRSAEETAKIIASRASIYISTNS